MTKTITNLRDHILTGYDRRRTTGKITVDEARSFSRRNVKEKDVSRNEAVKVAAQHGLQVLGAKPHFRLADSEGRLILNTAPYQMGGRYSDVGHYCNQLPLAKLGNELAAKSDAQVKEMATEYKGDF